LDRQPQLQLTVFTSLHSAIRVHTETVHNGRNSTPERSPVRDDVPRVLLRSEDSDGHLAVVELTGRGRPRLHRHDFDETFYILEGELTFQLGEELVTRRVGEITFAPRGVAHTYANLSDVAPGLCW
jgi:quercetin dioxygenase-like cupin family protein